jgi:hypothetical protein
MKLNRRRFVQTLFAVSQAGIVFDLCFADENKSSLVTLPLLPDAGNSPTSSIFLPTSIPSQPFFTPDIQCPSIDYRGWKTWADVGAIMRGVPHCAMGQNWLSENDSKLRSGTVAVAHYNHDLIVYAELSDADIFNPVKQNGLPAYTQGDVLEIFLRAENEKNYLEHHITPDNYILQLMYPDKNMISNPDFMTLCASHIPIRSQVLVQPELSLWRILAIVPLDLLASHPKEEVSPNWKFSFCRYDYTRGEKDPILSSTSALTVLNFHDQAAWGKLSLM